MATLSPTNVGLVGALHEEMRREGDATLGRGRGSV
jgi:hypothetical protein